MVANTVEEFNPRDFSTCSTPRYVICVGVIFHSVLQMVSVGEIEVLI